MRKSNRGNVRLVTSVLLGIIIGFVSTLCVLMSTSAAKRACDDFAGLDDTKNLAVLKNIADNFYDSQLHHKRSVLGNAKSNSLPKSRQLVVVGIMTAQKFIATRAVAINETWAKYFPGKVIFFVSENATVPPGLPVVKLVGVDDTYPPQRKSFFMLRYLYNTYGETYDWFVRADDDVYIRGDRLEMLLRSLDSAKPLYIGQTGVGNAQEYGSLSLSENENYCMGGPGVVFSREALKLVAPHVDDCVSNLCTTHEDVEIGRCVRKYAHISCTWAYEMQQIFYNNQTTSTMPSEDDLNTAEVQRATTLHPFKNPDALRRLHYHVRRLKAADLRHKHIVMTREVEQVEAQLKELEKHGNFLPIKSQNLAPKLNGIDDIIQWDFLSPSVKFCADGVICPRHNAASYVKTALKDVSRQVLRIINKYARERGRILEFQDILYAYYRVDPLRGVQYITDLLLLYKRFKGSRLTVPVRRHAYLEQKFAKAEFISDDDYWNTHPVFMNNRSAYSISASEQQNEIVHIILPLAGRSSTFSRFVNQYESNFLEDSSEEAIKLVLVLFSGGSEDIGAENAKTLKLFDNLKAAHSNALFDIVKLDQQFNRAVGLTAGANKCPMNSLLLFLDVDLIFDNDFLHRVRLNTRRGRQVFYPMVFSQYNPNVLSEEVLKSADEFDDRRGYFRHFGFGIVSIYRSDLEQVGGLNTTIKGWGLEDVDLFEKCLHAGLKGSGLEIFRAPDPGLIHIYHAVNCDKSLSTHQYEMCLGSKASNFGSVETLVGLLPADDRSNL